MQIKPPTVDNLFVELTFKSKNLKDYKINFTWEHYF